MRRILSSLLLAIALILSPLAMIGSGPAVAQAPANHAVPAIGHCDEGEQAPESGKKQPGMERGCASACAALAPLGGCVVKAGQLDMAELSPQPDLLRSGIGPEGETPPPRISSEI